MKIQSIKKLILIAASMAISTSVFGQRSVMVHSNTSVLLYPTNLWSANASAARSGFGLTATWLTNTNVTNFRSDIGLVLLALTNTNVTNFRHDIGLGVSNSVLFNTLTVTNFKVTQSATNQSLRVIADLTFDAGGSIQMSDGYGISFAGEAGPRTRTNLSLGWSALTNTNASNFRSAIDIGWSALTNTNAANFRTAIGLGETNAVTNGSVTAQTFNVTAGGGIVLQSVLSNDASFRTNIRLGATWLTNTNVTNFRSAINLGWIALTNSNSGNSIISYNSSNNVIVGIVETNNISFSNSIVAPMFYGSDGTSTNIGGSINISGNQSGSIDLSGANVAFGGTGGSIIANGTYSSTGGTLDMSGSQFGNGGSITTKDGGGSIDTRGDGIFSGGSIDTSIGGGLISTRGTGTLELGTNGARTTLTGTATTNRSINFPNGNGTIALLTNSSSGISLVTVNTNGTVVSPTNFWQVAPIQTLVQTFIPTVSSNSYGTNARNLYVYSMSPAVSGVTNTIILPTNSATFDGDAATITHNGTTSSVTAVQQNGSATNFTTISNTSESVKFIREAGQWTFYHNISFVEPVRFTDGNIEANKAESRTNLGLGFAALTNTNTTNFQAAIFNTNTNVSNGGSFASLVTWMEVNVITNGVPTSFRIPLFK